MNGPLVRLALTGLLVVLLAVATVATWMGETTPEAAADEGVALFATRGCVGCHNGPDTTANMNLAPDLRALPEVAGTRRPDMTAESYVLESILAPQAFVVPGFEFTEMPTIPLDASEVEVLVAYLLGG